MKISTIAASAVALGASVLGQAPTVRYCDPLTSICYASFTNEIGVSYRVALPQVTTAPFDVILQVVAPLSAAWVGMAWGGRMTYDPLTVSWPNGKDVVASSRYTTAYRQPIAYSNAEYTPLKGTGANSTAWTLTVRCRGCSSWLDANGNTVTLNPTGTTSFAWARSTNAPMTPASNTSTFTAHDETGTWTHDLSIGRSSSFDAWVASNLLSTPPTSSSSIVSSSSTSTTSKSLTTLSTSTSTSTSTRTSTSTTVPPASTTAPAGPTQTHYGQCGGIGWTGPKICASPYTCKYSNDYYSQCV